VLANARLSPRSERRFRRWRWLAGPLFSMPAAVLVQEEGDAARWSGIGVPRERIHCAGSIKYDPGRAARAERVDEFRALLRGLWGDPLPPLLLAASTHAGEEKALASVFLELRREVPGVVFLAVPRHCERRAEVLADLAACGCTAALRSSLEKAPVRPEVLVIDTTGELRDWQAMASVVVIGKSFLAEGGQNPAEAIAAGVPVIAGPHMENFEPLMELLLAAGGITQVASLEALLPALRAAFSDPAAARASADRGRAALEQHRGATESTADMLMALSR
jgi:3-deoxy-D-manno-octulosonic-acid transferase